MSQNSAQRKDELDGLPQTPESAYSDRDSKSIQFLASKIDLDKLSSIGKDRLIDTLLRRVEKQNRFIDGLNDADGQHQLVQDTDMLISIVVKDLGIRNLPNDRKDTLIKILFNRVEQQYEVILRAKRETLDIQLDPVESKEKAEKKQQVKKQQPKAQEAAERKLEEKTRKDVKREGIERKEIERKENKPKEGNADRQIAKPVSKVDRRDQDSTETSKKPVSRRKSVFGLLARAKVLLPGARKNAGDDQENISGALKQINLEERASSVDSQLPQQQDFTSQQPKPQNAEETELNGSVAYISIYEDDEEEDEPDNEALFELSEHFVTAESTFKSTLKGTDPVIEVVHIRDGELTDVKYLYRGDSYYTRIKGKKFRLAKNLKADKLSYFYSDQHFKRELRGKDLSADAEIENKAVDDKCGHNGKAGKQQKCVVPDNLDVYLYHRNQTYIVRKKIPSVTPDVHVVAKRKTPFIKTLLGSSLFHLFAIIMGGFLFVSQPRLKTMCRVSSKWICRNSRNRSWKSRKRRKW